jgi:hypothetical protein
MGLLRNVFFFYQKTLDGMLIKVYLSSSVKVSHLSFRIVNATIGLWFMA